MNNKQTTEAKSKLRSGLHHTFSSFTTAKWSKKASVCKQLSILDANHKQSQQSLKSEAMGLFRFSVIADFAPDLTRQQSETCNNLTLQLRNAHLSLATKGYQGIANLFLSNWGLSFTQLLYYVSCQFLEASPWAASSICIISCTFVCMLSI